MWKCSVYISVYIAGFRVITYEKTKAPIIESIGYFRILLHKILFDTGVGCEGLFR